MPVFQEKADLGHQIASAAELIERMNDDYRFHPLFGVAMLKVSFELRPGKLPGFNVILKKILSGINTDESELDDFIRLHRSSLERRCKEVGI